MRFEPLTDEQRAMVESNTGLVHHAMRRRHVPTEDWDDVYQDGLLGLMRAVQKFDPSLGFALSTYAFAWINRFITFGQDERGGINYRAAKRAGRPGPPPPLSLDAPLADGEMTLIDAAADRTVDIETLVLARQELEAVAEQLRLICRDDVDRAVVDSMLTVQRDSRLKVDARIAARFGFSREAIRQRRKRIAARVRDRLEEAA